MTLIMAAKDPGLFQGTDFHSRAEFNLRVRAQLTFGWVVTTNHWTTAVQCSSAFRVTTELVFILFLNMYIGSEKKII